MKKAIIALLAILPTFQTLALDCDNAQTQLDMNQCANEEYKKADSELNTLYQDVLKRTSDEQTNLLKSAQNKWIEYRDSDCKFQTFQSKEGSIYPMVYAHCLANKTADRINEFKSMLNCEEGDMSCPL
ncbi:hypothetical protein BIY26_00990 [Brenneria goodwinii]|uniref:Lysozyme inhibitor LprI-like N-terminal domain-containing protein n=1 Tax=Brenneria goodwinii TaxID=1109412 RepID=A0AAE8JPX6_9GAMM|nr:lysozyme inhibitor LprI family protein [Brenneria goodwinii]ATA24195.1 hypothetical protein AWC36_08745 [Brenneria goodwinii]RLM29154.1 hypothetical protein BIY26_00990 [Brenneria goodwinii]